MFVKLLLILFVLFSTLEAREAWKLTLKDFETSEIEKSIKEQAREELEEPLPAEVYGNYWHIGKHEEMIKEFLEDLEYWDPEPIHQRHQEYLKLIESYKTGKIDKKEMDRVLVEMRKTDRVYLERRHQARKY
ncbi:unnamed protein product [Caenorhabditis angaria]|uniref:EF-hand domain-containing protein n=1 Tax=Caenorhabditis angaria TaxID=860376 RepID=A0A9P1IYU1_9PELO|nr:unnamed protein product [Caenorhabditis angaria]